jgi:hypothetical protein
MIVIIITVINIITIIIIIKIINAGLYESENNNQESFL